MSCYQIIEAQSVRELTTRVISKMEQGWLPTGGLAINTESESRYAQAMIQIEEVTDASYPELKVEA